MDATSLIQYGLGFVGLAIMLGGVMHSRLMLIISIYHEGLSIDPLLAPRTFVERRHMTKACPDCSFHAELRSTLHG
jgi:hypothetical protein